MALPKLKSVLPPGIAVGLIAAVWSSAAIAATAPSTEAQAALSRHPYELLAHTPSGGVPNGPASDPALSGDSRISRYAGYTSSATDIVAGSGGFRNVYVVSRAGLWGDNGTPWRQGATMLVSRGLAGQPANGDSWGPSFDGYEYGVGGRLRVAVPKCVAFVSAASNLAPGDTNGHADVFVGRLPNGGITRIATPSAASYVDVDALCRQVAYVADGTAYVQAANGRGRPQRRSPRGGVTSAFISGNDHLVTFERNGSIYTWHWHHGTHRVAQGTGLTVSVYGTAAAFVSGDEILSVNTLGTPRVTRIDQNPSGTVHGAEPSITFGSHFIFYVTGPDVRSNIFGTLMGHCDDGSDAHQPAAGPHGNYVAFACSSGQVYLTYVGPK